jgi:hypothetical protein
MYQTIEYVDNYGTGVIKKNSIGIDAFCCHREI